MTKLSEETLTTIEARPSVKTEQWCLHRVLITESERDALCQTVRAAWAERDDLLNRSHQTIMFECGCVFQQNGLDAEPQMIEHCTLWAEAERNAMIDTIAELEKEPTHPARAVGPDQGDADSTTKLSEQTTMRELHKPDSGNAGKTTATMNENGRDKQVKCQQCGAVISIKTACAIGKTFVAFYYCSDCFDVVANEED